MIQMKSHFPVKKRKADLSAPSIPIESATIRPDSSAWDNEVDHLQQYAFSCSRHSDLLPSGSECSLTATSCGRASECVGAGQSCRERPGGDEASRLRAGVVRH